MKRNKMRTRLFAGILAAGCICCGVGLSAAAVTVDDVAQKAREVGYPEELVQTGYNMWATGQYTQADLEAAYAELCKYDSQADDKIDSIFDTSTAETTPPATEPDRTGSETDSSSQAETAAPTETAGGTISSADFINMTLDEKIAYVNSMAPEDKDAFLNNLSPEERNSIIWQMSVNDKAELMQGYIDAAEKMNMNIVVDSLSDEGISVTVRDNEGIVVDKTGVGITIDETGISYTGVLASAAAAVVLAAAGIAGLYRYVCGSDEHAQ